MWLAALSHAIPRLPRGPRPDLGEYRLVAQKSRNTFFFVYEGILGLGLPLSLPLHLSVKAMCGSDTAGRRRGGRAVVANVMGSLKCTERGQKW